MLWRRRALTMRRLGAYDRSAALAFLDRDPVSTILARVPLAEARSLRPAHALGLFDAQGNLCALCWHGANLVPCGFDESGLDILAREIRQSRRIFSSIVGSADQVMGLWQRIEHRFARPREIRDNQLSMVYGGQPCVAPDPAVRLAEVGEGALIVPASVSMFIEEVGYDPRSYGDMYARRVHELVRTGRTFVRMGRDVRGEERVEFKADIGALGGGVAQIQGVWTAPDVRGRGIGAAAMVSVAQEIQRRIAPTVSLYVNDYNFAAVRAYEKAGFIQVGQYATILF
ncbi:GNAT family N-acetyltransferase [Trueperella sp. LYQ143]|uniref:GNAT family N-acetyltransferase n=1 Tax=unclassified Trueperella TaxID=2630174 RepID=UPI003982E35B